MKDPIRDQSLIKGCLCVFHTEDYDLSFRIATGGDKERTN